MELTNIDLVLDNIHLKCSLSTKYNILTGFSGIGKTSLVRNILNRQEYKDHEFLLDYNKNKWFVVTRLRDLNYVNNYDITIMDEDISKSINSIMTNPNHLEHKTVSSIFKDSVCKFIFIGRNLPCFPISYKSVYTLEYNFDIIVITRLFQDFNSFNSRLPILIEDSTTGLEYYQYHYNDVRSSHGKDNLVYNAKSSDQIVADGSAIGTLVNELYYITNNLYLSESFEYDLAINWQPKDKLVTDYFSSMPDNTESVEQYFENIVLPELCRKNYMTPYRKSKSLDKVLLNVVIHKESSNLNDLRKQLSTKYLNAHKETNTTVLSQSIPDVTIEEFYNSAEVDVELRCYLALIYMHKIEPLAEDKQFFD